MANRNLQVNLTLNTQQAQQALKQLQQQASQVGKGSGGSGGSGGGGGFGGLKIPGMPGFGGGMAGFAAGAAAAGIAAVSKEMGELAKRATELSRAASTSSSALGQLRSAIERNNMGKDIAAGNPGVIDFAKMKEQAGKALVDFVAGLSGSVAEKNKQVGERLSQGLGGQAGESWRRMKIEGQDMEQDIGMARQAQSVKWFRAERDFAMEKRRFDVESANQLFDLQKQAQRQAQDYSMAKQRFDENFAGKQAAKEFALQQKYAQQSYQISRERATYDFQVGMGRSAQDYSIGRSRNLQDFQRGQSRNAEDYQENLQKAVMGGASGMELFWMARDYRKSVTRNAQDFSLSQSRAGQDFSLSQSRNIQDYNLSQGRGAQDFSIQQQQALAGRQLQIEAELYQRKWEGVQLEIQHNRNLQDESIAMQRFLQATGFQKESFANRAGDMAYDKALDQYSLNLTTGRQRRNYGYGLADFAGQQRLENSVGAAGQASIDPTFAQAARENAKQWGLPDLMGQFNQTLQEQENGLAYKLGQSLRKALGEANDDVGDMYNPKNNLLGTGPTSPRSPWGNLLTGGINWAGQQVGNIYNPNNSLLGNNGSVNNIGGGNNIQVTVNGIDPNQLEQRMTELAAKYAQMAADAMAADIKKLYGF